MSRYGGIREFISSEAKKKIGFVEIHIYVYILYRGGKSEKSGRLKDCAEKIMKNVGKKALR